MKLNVNCIKCITNSRRLQLDLSHSLCQILPPLFSYILMLILFYIFIFRRLNYKANIIKIHLLRLHGNGENLLNYVRVIMLNDESIF